MTTVWFAIFCLVSGFVTDLIWTPYIRAVARYEQTKNKRDLRTAANYSAGTGLCTLLLVEAVILDPLISSFWLAGLWLGTYYSGDVKRLWENYRCRK